MQFVEPRCWTRRCKHFQGIKMDDSDPKAMKAWAYCDAFPDGIPIEIMNGSNDHTKPFSGDHGIQYVKEKARKEVKRVNQVLKKERR